MLPLFTATWPFTSWLAVSVSKRLFAGISTVSRSGEFVAEFAGFYSAVRRFGVQFCVLDNKPADLFSSPGVLVIVI